MFHVEHLQTRALVGVKLQPGAPGALTRRNGWNGDGLASQLISTQWHSRPRLCLWFWLSTEHRRGRLCHRFLGTPVAGREGSDVASFGLQSFRRTRASGAPDSQDDPERLHFKRLPLQRLHLERLRPQRVHKTLAFGPNTLVFGHGSPQIPMNPKPAKVPFINNALTILFHVEHSAYPPYPRRCINLGHCRLPALPLASEIEEQAWPE
jgi:hypothetical protein